ncbi:MAG TPA: tricarballylate utilization 4Fe-4S protein TcuB [Gemmatimonadaceae bacterium]
MSSVDTIAEARRSMELCNACRYCEGFCAVFPAMELRRAFSDGDLNYLANLCHNCRGCYYACQYAPPHEFAINIPRTLAEVRNESYADYAWPAGMARLFRSNGTVVAIVTALGIALVLLLAGFLQSPTALLRAHHGPGAFYQVIPLGIMTAIALATTAYSAIAMTVSSVRFWRDTGGGRVTLRSLLAAASDVATLRNLGGGGGGCNDINERFSLVRRRYHHALFYGFMLCFASTSVAALYEHLLHRSAPYPFFSIPVLLGTAGGLGMLVGSAGLIWIKRTADDAPTSRSFLGGEYALLVLLGLCAATGFMLLLMRSTRAMGPLLALHLGIIFAFFLVIPYSKFVHGFYRAAALLRAAHERDIAASGRKVVVPGMSVGARK